jgi:hypothetical protein
VAGWPVNQYECGRVEHRAGATARSGDCHDRFIAHQQDSPCGYRRDASCRRDGLDAPAPAAAARAATVVSRGTWGKAREVPGLGALNAGGDAQISSLSCGSAGNCSAGGSYEDSSGYHSQAFVVSQAGGTWGKATEVAAALNAGRNASLNSVSCASAGNCSAGGSYADSSGHTQAFVVDETTTR